VFDWRNGEKHAVDFMTGAYLDVYDGNINTLENMRVHHSNKYHTMMADIYAKVRCVSDSLFDSNHFLLSFNQLNRWWYHGHCNC